jgi:hypothetical protein
MITLAPGGLEHGIEGENDQIRCRQSASRNGLRMAVGEISSY